MTTLIEVTDAETARDDAIAARDLLTDTDPGYSEAQLLVDTTTAEATTLRTAYEIEQHTEASNKFDLDSAEEFYVSTEFGNLKSDNDTLDQVDLGDLTSDTNLAGAFFNTHEGTRYYWSTGNTYTFGGGYDYAFCNSYEVSIGADCLDDDFNTWDGSFPYDIYGPKDGVMKSGSDIDATDYEDSFDNLPDAYKIVVPLPLGSLFFRDPENGVDFSKNAVSKNVGHTYGYQLGDTYDIQISQNTNDIKAVDMEHNFESVGVSENHSHVGVSANFNAHGMDVQLGIKAVDIDLDITGIKFDMKYSGANFQYTYTGIDIVYENAAKRYLILDRPEFRISDDNLRTLTKEKIEKVAGKSIVLQVESNKNLMDMPEKVMGKGDKKIDAGDLIPMAAWYRALTGSSSDAEDAFVDVMDNTDFNGDREEDVKRKTESYSRLDIDQEAMGFASFSDGNSMAEFVLNSKKKFGEFNIRDVNSSPAQKKINITQKFDLDEGRYTVTQYLVEKQFGKFWISGLGDGANGYDADSVGMMAQAEDKKYNKLNMNSANSFTELEVHESDSKSIDTKFDAKNGLYSLKLADGSDESSLIIKNENGSGGWISKSGSKEFGLIYSAGVSAKISVVDSDESFVEIKKAEVIVETAKLTMKPVDSATLTSKKITLDSDTIKVGSSDFKKASAKIPQSTVTLGASPNQVKITSSGVKISGAKVAFKGTSMAEIKAALIKLG